MPLYPATIELSSLDGNNGFQINGGAGEYSGWSVASAGDINGDGFDDVIVGAPFADTTTGAAYVVFGSDAGFASTVNVSSLDGNNGFRIGGGATYALAGDSVSSAGDINGDGIDDLIVGAPAANASYVVFGTASGFDATLDLSSLDGNNGLRIDGAGDYSGKSVAAAGDVNGDGIGDLIVGAPNAGPSTAGASYVVFGNNAGFDATLDLSSLDGNNGFVIGGIANDASGWSVASAGDVNGDGIDDLILGGAGTAVFSGDDAAYVVFGNSTGFGATVNASSLDGNNGFLIIGGASGPTGKSVASAGDINGDGLADMIVGTYGGSYVVFGSGSGFGAAVDLDSLNGNNGFFIADDVSGQSIGSVASAGDFNGDGFNDLLIGTRYADPHGVNSGAAYIVFGKASGYGVVTDLSSLDGDNGIRINGETAHEQAGFSVASAGDVNGDGLADIIVGAPYDSASYVIFGSLPAEAVARTGTAVANTIHGSNFDDTLVGLGGNDTLLGHDGNDTILGGDGNDSIDAGAGDDFVTGGNGNDDIDGGYRDDTVYGGAGKDTLQGGGGDDRLFGGNSKDTLRGGNGTNVLDGGAGRDTDIGGNGQDTFVFGRASDSTGRAHDTVRGADFAVDQFDAPRGVTGIDATVATGALNKGATFDVKLAAAVDGAHLDAHHAVIFTPDSGSLAGTVFLVVDVNGVAGYQSGADVVVELGSPANLASIDIGNFI